MPWNLPAPEALSGSNAKLLTMRVRLVRCRSENPIENLEPVHRFPFELGKLESNLAAHPLAATDNQNQMQHEPADKHENGYLVARTFSLTTSGTALTKSCAYAGLSDSDDSSDIGSVFGGHSI